MIYTLESQYNQGLYIQWIEVLKRTGLNFENLIWNLSHDSTLLNFSEFLEKQEVIDKINSIITSDDFLLVDSSFIHPGSSMDLEFYQNIDYILSVVDKINAKKILIFHPDSGYHTEFYYNDKIQIITPMYNIFKDKNIKEKYNFYLFNCGYSHHRWLSTSVFDRYLEMVRYKKFLSHNGYLKPHRLLLYHLLKKDNLLDGFFYSNIAYNVYGRQGEYIGDENEISYEVQMIEPFSNEIQNIITREEYDSIIKNDLPIFMDYSPLTSNVDQYAFTLPYTCNSYIEVICGTNYSSDSGEWGEVYTSEKIYKAFLSYQIPLYLCQPLMCKTLKTLGFDLFEDLFDLSYDEEKNDLKKILMFHENIKKVSNMSLRELHKYYLDNRSRVIHNYNLLKELSNLQIEGLKKMLQ